MKLPGFFAEASLYWSTEEYRMTGTSSEGSESVYRQQSCNRPDQGLCNGTFTDLTSDQSYGRFGDTYDSEQTAVVPAFPGICPGDQIWLKGRCVCPPDTHLLGSSPWCFPIGGCQGDLIRINGICGCPRDYFQVGTSCIVNRRGCTGGQIRIKGKCKCPPMTVDIGSGECLCPGAGSVLDNGRCVCPVGETRCSNKIEFWLDPCINLDNDLDNCGECFNKCEGPANGFAICNGGKCTTGCFTGQILVNGQCVGHLPENGKCSPNEPTTCNDGHGHNVCGCFCNCSPVKVPPEGCSNNTAPAFCP
jgi:hypothetical protein